MNPEIYTIIKDMRNRFPVEKCTMGDSERQIYLSIRSSQLSVLLAEEEEAQNKVILHNAEETVRLTRAIYILTGVMLFIGVIQIIVAVKFS